jgi:hypothetical protein
VTQEHLVDAAGQRGQVGGPVPGWLAERGQRLGVQRVDEPEDELVLVPEMPVYRGRVRAELRAEGLEGEPVEAVGLSP